MTTKQKDAIRKSASAICDASNNFRNTALRELVMIVKSCDFETPVEAAELMLREMMEDQNNNDLYKTVKDWESAIHGCLNDAQQQWKSEAARERICNLQQEIKSLEPIRDSWP